VSTNDLVQLGVMLPAKWIRVDLDPETRAEAHAAIVAERGGPALEQGATEADLTGLLEGVALTARAAGGIYAAFYSDVLGGRQVAASLVISVIEASGAPPPPDADAATLAASLRNLLAGEGETDVRELPVGPAVRLRRQSAAPVPGGGSATAPVMNVATSSLSPACDASPSWSSPRQPGPRRRLRRPVRHHRRELLVELTDLVIQTPVTWYVIDPDRSTRRATAEADVSARTAETPAFAPHREDIVEGLLDLADEAESMGALFAAAYWEPTEAGPLIADLLVLEGRRACPDDPDAEIADLLDALAAPAKPDLGPREVSTGELPIGTAVRVRVLLDLSWTTRGGPVKDVTQHWVPLGRDGHCPGEMAVVAASTPTLHISEDVAGVCDRAARSLAFAGSA
jgi:hypothetical protein